MNEVSGRPRRSLIRRVMVGTSIFLGASQGTITARGQQMPAPASAQSPAPASAQSPAPASAQSPATPAPNPKTCPPTTPPQYPTTTPTAYTLTTTDPKGQPIPFKIQYRTWRNFWTGVINLYAAKPSPASVDIAVTDRTGVAPAEIEADFEVTYNGKKGRYHITKVTSQISPTDPHYTVDLKDFATKFLADVNEMLPRSFDPNAAPSFSTSVAIAVTVTPKPGPGQKSFPAPVGGTLTIVLEQVLGDP